MSSALAKAAPLKPEIRLAQAVSLFEADLSTDQKATFCSYRLQARNSPPDIHNVMRLTAEIDRYTFGSGGRCYGPRMTNILQSVQQFAALGDIVIGGSQILIACGVWSLVRMALLSILNFSSCLEKISAFLMTAGRSAPRYERMALLYPRSKALQSHLAEYFIVIVRLCHQLLKLAKKSTLERLMPSSNDLDLKNYQSEFDIWASSIRDEVNMLMAQNINEQSSNIKALLKLSESDLHRRRMKARGRVLKACSTYDYQTTWKEIRKAGNTILFNQVPEYHDWKAQAGSRTQTLVYTGKLGSGKSVLLANIIDDLNLHVPNAKCPVAYFFCRHDILESLTARTILGSLARQLLQSISDLTQVEHLVDTTTALNTRDILDILRCILTPAFKAYFVLDGLNECNRSERSKLLSDLYRLRKICTLSLCLSFRLGPDSVTRSDWQQLEEPCTITMPDDNPDIKTFINAELGRRVETEALKIGDPAMILEIEDALLERAHGMFLWTALQIEALCMAKTDEAIRHALIDLPKDLPETYSRILARSRDLETNYHMRIFELVTVAHRPLTTEELREALSVVPGDDMWNPSRLLNDVYSALATCGSLITIDEEESTVKLVHHSVKQFLFDLLHPDGRRMTSETANRTMGAIIVTYLSYGIFETQLSKVVAPQMMAEAAPSRIIRSLDASSAVQSVALKLLRSRKQRESHISIGRSLAEAKQLFRPLSASEFQFHSYAKSYCLRHVSLIEDPAPFLFNLLLKVLNRRIDDMVIWGDETQRSLVWALRNGREELVDRLLEQLIHVKWRFRYYSPPPLLWAVENGYLLVVRLLLEKGDDIEQYGGGPYRKRPLILAAENGHEPIVRLLCEKGANVNSTCGLNGRTSLSHVACAGLPEGSLTAIIRLLLENGANIECLDPYERTPLSLAVSHGDNVATRLLLENGASIEIQDNWGRTPLALAAEKGRETIVRLLLETGASINIQDNLGLSPLASAAREGHETVVRLLLENGASIEIQDDFGYTPLMSAAKQGHETIVRLLLENGASIGAFIITRDSQKITPLDLAKEKNHTAIVRILSEWRN